MNLLLNAVEAMGSEGALTVRTGLAAGDPGIPGTKESGRKPNYLRVEIIDTGSGIAPEKIRSIFDPFFTTKPQGTGLGLAVTRRIVEEHHGVIRVNSQPGKGTTFTVLLPVTAPEKTMVDAGAGARASLDFPCWGRGSTVDATRAEAGAHGGACCPNTWSAAIHNGQVQRAIFLCASKRSRSARLNVMRIIGTMTTASTVCVSSSIR